MITKKDRNLEHLVVGLCILLVVSICFNFGNSASNIIKSEHLGAMTYSLPEDGEWFAANLSNNDATYGIDGETGRVLRKSYIDASTLSQVVVGYNVLAISLDDKNIVSWDDQYGQMPVGLEGFQMAVNEIADDFDMYAHWCATFTLDGKLYVIDIYGNHINSDEALAMGESLVASIDLNNQLTDEYK